MCSLKKSGKLLHKKVDAVGFKILLASLVFSPWDIKQYSYLGSQEYRFSHHSDLCPLGFFRTSYLGTKTPLAPKWGAVVKRTLVTLGTKLLVVSDFECLFENRCVLKTLQIRNCIYLRHSARMSFVFSIGFY